MRFVMRLVLCGAALASCLSGAAAAADLHGRIDRAVDIYVVQPDLTYVQTSELDVTLLNERGLRAGERSASSYYADRQTLEVLEAWVDQPDGSRLTVPPSAIFTRPSAAAQNAPGFNGSLTTTVLFPQLREGSRTHVKWRRTQLSPALLGLNVWNQPPQDWEVAHDETTILAPAGLPLHWRARGGVAVTDTVADGVRRIHATMDAQPAQVAERGSVAASDYQPLFLLTSIGSLAEIGAIYHRQSAAQASVTPAIAAKAAEITGGRTGLAAARAVYNWVTTNIRYVAIYMNPNDGWVPHAAEQVLQSGYGDCKDHVVLMQALLAASGIRAEAALIDWGSRTEDLPLWLPGQFNHAIIHLPDFGLFANPTDPFASFDALDRRLSGKTVVLATPEGQAARTPDASPAQFRYAIASTLSLDADGGIAGISNIAASPSLDGRLRATVAGAASATDLAERLLSGTPEGGTGRLTSTDPHALDQPFEAVVTWTSPGGISFQGNEAYPRVPAGPDLEPAIRLRAKLSPDGIRRTPLLADIGDYLWTTRIVPQPGLAITRLPDDVALENRTGRYTATYRRDGAETVVRRHLVIARDVVAPPDYPALAALLTAAINDSRTALVVSRGEAATAAAVTWPRQVSGASPAAAALP